MGTASLKKLADASNITIAIAMIFISINAECRHRVAKMRYVVLLTAIVRRDFSIRKAIACLVKIAAMNVWRPILVPAVRKLGQRMEVNAFVGVTKRSSLSYRIRWICNLRIILLYTIMIFGIMMTGSSKSACQEVRKTSLFIFVFLT